MIRAIAVTTMMVSAIAMKRPGRRRLTRRRSGTIDATESAEKTTTQNDNWGSCEVMDEEYRGAQEAWKSTAKPIRGRGRTRARSNTIEGPPLTLGGADTTKFTNTYEDSSNPIKKKKKKKKTTTKKKKSKGVIKKKGKTPQKCRNRRSRLSNLNAIGKQRSKSIEDPFQNFFNIGEDHQTAPHIERELKRHHGEIYEDGDWVPEALGEGAGHKLMREVYDRREAEEKLMREVYELEKQDAAAEAAAARAESVNWTDIQWYNNYCHDNGLRQDPKEFMNWVNGYGTREEKMKLSEATEISKEAPINWCCYYKGNKKPTAYKFWKYINDEILGGSVNTMEFSVAKKVYEDYEKTAVEIAEKVYGDYESAGIIPTPEQVMDFVNNKMMCLYIISYAQAQNVCEEMRSRSKAYTEQLNNGSKDADDNAAALDFLKFGRRRLIDRLVRAEASFAQSIRM